MLNPYGTRNCSAPSALSDTAERWLNEADDETDDEESFLKEEPENRSAADEDDGFDDDEESEEDESEIEEDESDIEEEESDIEEDKDDEKEESENEEEDDERQDQERDYEDIYFWLEMPNPSAHTATNSDSPASKTMATAPDGRLYTHWHRTNLDKIAAGNANRMARGVPAYSSMTGAQQRSYIHAAVKAANAHRKATGLHASCMFHDDGSPIIKPPLTAVAESLGKRWCSNPSRTESSGKLILMYKTLD